MLGMYYSAKMGMMLPPASLACGGPALAPSRSVLPVMTERSLDRRTANAVGMLTLLNICSLSLRKEPLPVIEQSRWAPTQAAEAALAGALCPTVSCADARFAEVNALLDTTGIQMNAQGKVQERKPVVYLETAFGLKGSAAPAQYHVVVVSPLGRGAGDTHDRVQLMWLRDAESGRVVAARSFDAEGEGSGADAPPTLVGTLKEPYAGVHMGQKLVPLVLYERDGLWVGDTFTLCSPDAQVCAGSGLFTPASIREGGPHISTVNRLGAARIGTSVMQAATAASR